MEKYKLIMEKIGEDDSLAEQYAAIVAKHEPTRDISAFAAEISELARSKGFDLAAEDILSAPQAKGEMTEEQLENVSGGGAWWAPCIYSLDCHFKNITVKKDEFGRHWGTCPRADRVECSYFGCRCWETSHCKGGWHKCHPDGIDYFGHAITV